MASSIHWYTRAVGVGGGDGVAAWGRGGGVGGVASVAFAVTSGVLVEILTSGVEILTSGVEILTSGVLVETMVGGAASKPLAVTSGVVVENVVGGAASKPLVAVTSGVGVESVGSRGGSEDGRGTASKPVVVTSGVGVESVATKGGSGDGGGADGGGPMSEWIGDLWREKMGASCRSVSVLCPSVLCPFCRRSLTSRGAMRGNGRAVAVSGGEGGCRAVAGQLQGGCRAVAVSGGEGGSGC